MLVSAPSSPPQALATAVQGAGQNDSSSILFRWEQFSEATSVSFLDPWWIFCGAVVKNPLFFFFNSSHFVFYLAHKIVVFKR